MSALGGRGDLAGPAGGHCRDTGARALPQTWSKSGREGVRWGGRPPSGAAARFGAGRTVARNRSAGRTRIKAACLGAMLVTLTLAAPAQAAPAPAPQSEWVVSFRLEWSDLDRLERAARDCGAGQVERR